ncbi:inc metabolism membrane protein [Microbotryomycetes sp. JL221]|nr:inc metabolism membrane protein [Microbotryomycetes sp. JL221]
MASTSLRQRRTPNIRSTSYAHSSSIATTSLDSATTYDHDHDDKDDKDDDLRNDSNHEHLTARHQSLLQRPGTGRHRSQSMRQPRSTSSTVPFISLTSYPSSMLEGLDLPKSILNLRDLLLGKLEQVEKDVRKLQEWSETDENTTSPDTDDDDDQDDQDQETQDEDEDEDEDDEATWQVVTRKRTRSKAHSRRHSTTSCGRSNASDSSQDDQDRHTTLDPNDLSTLRSFTQSASDFLRALRSELPSLQYRPAMSSPVIQWELSPEARQTLDKFLEDHPLPTFPQLDLRARFGDSKQLATDSATSLLARVSDELTSLRDLVSKLERPSTSFSSYLPSPSIKIQDLREYFSNESIKLGQKFKSLKNSSSSNLNYLRNETAAGFQKMQEGANELSAIVSSKSHHALDEAARLYHAALDMGKERLLQYDELPHAWRNNPYILSGYRFVEIDRWGDLLKSSFEWHNETVNIQSHLIGCLSLVYLLLCVFPNSAHYLPNAHPLDRVVALLFIVGAMKCLLCSVAWHLFAGCATGHWHRGAACVDYVGISGLIAASIIGIEYYGFYCKPAIAAGYMAFSAICGIVGMILPWKPWFNEYEYKMWRIAFFLSLAGSALTPIGHLAILYGIKDTVIFFFPVALSAIAYLIGLSFYAHQFPECAQPGRWDNLFASHQLWHIAIVCAVWLHWFALSSWATAVAQGTDLSCRALGV